ncbi:mechanosensitive ion channel family protein [Oceanibacterium hippocampi]|uniref:Small-conductance mechanosensitive channel n=1 Tax=Oceanibacterium hippocampi TaxID=745714 RepID=A0A1Y5TRC6_9PROT|nr:mechanosensitive ion channel family protein [Oceanibacterium hippocampi]SLN70158.1 Small-conductance mechanosensitive channel [Oceanibacterium hippocampi]
MENQIETINSLLETLIAFVVAYGFQILGALVVLVIGLKVASWFGRYVARRMEARAVDTTLSRFLGNVVKLVLVVMVVIITLGNFGITIAPLIAAAGAAAFGATVAIQGPLSNYGAGISIILTRPFVVGNTLTVKHVSGVVEEITLGQTILIGEDGERITIPNRQIVGEILINSDAVRIVESRLHLAFGENPKSAVAAIREAIAETMNVGKPDLASLARPEAQVGIEDFAPWGFVIGLRYWVPSQQYYIERFRINAAVHAALAGKGIKLLPVAAATAQSVASITANTSGYRES